VGRGWSRGRTRSRGHNHRIGGCELDDVMTWGIGGLLNFWVSGRSMLMCHSETRICESVGLVLFGDEVIPKPVTFDLGYRISGGEIQLISKPTSGNSMPLDQCASSSRLLEGSRSWPSRPPWWKCTTDLNASNPATEMPIGKAINPVSKEATNSKLNQHNTLFHGTWASHPPRPHITCKITTPPRTPAAHVPIR
jgi:hypothetical protein